VLDHGRHAADREPLAAPLRAHPHALHLAGVRRDGADLSLEDDLAVLEPGERAAGPDQLGEPRLVVRAAVGAGGRDADLLGEHRDGGRQQQVDLVRADPADQRVGVDGRRRAERHDRLA
jgi:hypothetical protein